MSIFNGGQWVHWEIKHVSRINVFCMGAILKNMSIFRPGRWVYWGTKKERIIFLRVLWHQKLNLQWWWQRSRSIRCDSCKCPWVCQLLSVFLLILECLLEFRRLETFLVGWYHLRHCVFFGRSFVATFLLVLGSRPKILEQVIDIHEICPHSRHLSPCILSCVRSLFSNIVNNQHIQISWYCVFNLLIEKCLRLNELTAWQPPLQVLTVASKTKKLDSGILKALKVV